MQPLSPEEARWARSLGMLEKEESYWAMVKRNPRRALEEVAGLLLVAALIGVCVVLAGVM